jgi:uncharacterized membrane protein YraQ (UPF0718 family)
MLFICLAFWNYHEADANAVVKGLLAAEGMAKSVVISIFISFLVAGQMQVLITRHKDVVVGYLNGKNGIWTSAGVGVVTPSLSAFPIAQDLWEKGLAPLGVILAVIVASRLLNVQTMLFFLPYLGWKLSLVSIAASIAVVVVFVFAVKAIS